MRALLVVNPKATTTSERGRDVLARALRSEVDLTVAYTRRRGHAADLARKAVVDGLDVIVTLGGDGTVNEVINGMLRDGPVHDDGPALAVVPGGSTNVFARALGLPKDTVEGAGVILDALHTGRARSIGLGCADGRYFTFCAGYGIDAAVVRTVERARLRGRTSTPALFMRSTMAQYFLDTDRRAEPIVFEWPGHPPRGDISPVASVIVQNTSPWTYIGDRAVTACPQASFDTGLDAMAMRSLHLPATMQTISQLLRQASPHGRQHVVLHDLAEFTLRSRRPLAFQLDGEYLGERTRVTFASVPDAIRVFC